MPVSRRRFLAASAAVALPFARPPARAAGPAPAAAQVPGVYRYKVGAFEVTSLLDGVIDVPATAFPAAPAAETARLMARNFLPGPAVRSPVTAYLVKTGPKTVLIDTGSAKLLGPTMGDLPAGLKAAGVDPVSIDTVLLTHLHPDHVNGLLTADGRAAFPNAEVVVAEAEAKFWHDDGVAAKTPAEYRPFVKMARDALAAYPKRVRLFAGETEVLPGIAPVPEPGHTPGHTGYMLSSGGDSLWVWGDIVHVAAFQFPHPEWAVAFDTDPKQAVATRKAALDRAATDKLVVAGMHLPFPGRGHIFNDGGRYEFVPVPWSPTLEAGR